MNDVIKCITEIFTDKSTGPVGLCSFEHSLEPEKRKPVKKENRREMRLSELME